MVRRMKTLMLVSLVTSMLGATGASAACYAEYKAKRDNPLELIYDVAQIGGDCTMASASAELAARLAAQGITLLKVLSVSDR